MDSSTVGICLCFCRFVGTPFAKYALHTVHNILDSLHIMQPCTANKCADGQGFRKLNHCSTQGYCPLLTQMGVIKAVWQVFKWVCWSKKVTA